jgi:gliding motility-associated lipoprotein GldD
MRILLTLFSLSTLLVFTSCESEFTPKPRGYFRLDMPQKTYQRFDTLYPFSFDYPSYAQVQPYRGGIENKYWLNIEYPQQRATLHLSYFNVQNDLNKHLEESRTLAYKHTVKADAIDEHLVAIPNNKVYGLVYDIKGNAASCLQFYVTDSSKHFLRGALYFNVPPNSDSLAPVSNFIKRDVERMIENLNWK